MMPVGADYQSASTEHKNTIQMQTLRTLLTGLFKHCTGNSINLTVEWNKMESKRGHKWQRLRIHPESGNLAPQRRLV